ncbi:Gfo/Idh/MocA family oxidoreductase [Maribellus sp. CM-23]|uniref:Gfo/Idh/MocA family oxidoreductase n=1 Tax=Maribellus sp. CM-23 TaxID=2781026 RepID=UPI001F405B8D|nr:Gfo/Idh/MocA family oxidoreductase [Maribellus sp. CM-23]MCE4566660.1 Gfo/Idh/MocA family oxidoreductase [Maribellus sp. CM-23]
MKRFAIIGAAGFVAERHIRAIKETGNEVVAAMDPFDVMGRMDSYFPEAEFFSSENELAAFIGKCKKEGNPVDFLSICSPNFLHFKHIELALKSGCNVICEKPLVIQAADLDKIKILEEETGKKVYTVLQLRYHPAILQLKKEVDSNTSGSYSVNLTYITSRGKWYVKSWKGDPVKSGGVAANIGIHFFDMLSWIFGSVKKNEVKFYEPTKASGELTLEKASVNWFLSIDAADLPDAAIINGQRTWRSITVNDTEIEFSDGFTDLHTETYRQILAGNGFGVECARESIQLVEEMVI